MKPLFESSQVFLVTGASSGIGRSIARSLLDQDATVLSCGRDEARLRSISTDPRCIPVVRDLTVQTESVADWVVELAQQYGPLSGIVHSAGILGNSPLRVLGRALLERVLELNFFAFLMLAKGLVQDGVCDPRGGSLLLLSSVASLRGLSSAVAYSASKGAGNAAVIALAKELAPLAIRCNAILPGVIETEMTEGVDTSQVDYLLAQQFIGGRIQASDIADLCALLLSERARFITGQLIAVDAGSGYIPGPRPFA